MTRVAYYARFSSDLQDAKSITDQLAMLDRAASERGWQHVATYSDEAISGESMITRPGLLRLLAEAGERKFDLVATESLDRLSRDLADTGQIYKQLQFHSIGIHTLSDGEISIMHVGLKGLVGQLFLDDLRHKTRRGLQGVVTSGRSAGGRTFGYRLTGNAGELEIDEDQAEIVREIHDRFAAGESAMALARDLNQRGVEPPRTGHWRASAISGQRHAGNGILNNELYIGRRIWNRRRKVTDPATGKKRMRARPESEWIFDDVPDLRIVSDEQWQATKSRQDSVHVGKGKGKKSLRILSGLLRCGHCGAPFNISGKDRYYCSARKLGMCDNGRGVSVDVIDRRVVNAIRQQLTDPELIRVAAQTYHDARAEAERQAVSERQEIERRLADTRGALDRMSDRWLATDDADLIKILGGKVKALEQERAELQRQLDAAPIAPPVRLHPNAGARFGELASDLVTTLRADDGAEARAAFRALIQSIDIQPDDAAPDGMRITVRGDLAALLGGEIVSTNVGAGVGFEPTTFRL